MAFHDTATWPGHYRNSLLLIFTHKDHQSKAMQKSSFIFTILSTFIISHQTEKSWKEKDVSQYNDGDFDNLYDQWEENDDVKIPNDELPYGHPERPDYSNIRLEDVNMNDKDAIKKFSTLKKNILVTATLTGNPTRF